MQKRERKKKTVRREGAGETGILPRATRAAALTVAFAAVALLLAAAAAYRTADPGRYVLFAAMCALALTALCCGFFSYRAAQNRAMLCALIASGETALLFFLLSFIFGGPGGITAPAYAVYIGVAVLFSRLLCLRPRRARHRRH